MLYSVEQAFVGRDERRAPLKTPAWEATQPWHYKDLTETGNRARKVSGTQGSRLSTSSPLVPVVASISCLEGLDRVN